MTNFWCVPHRGTPWRTRGPATSNKLLPSFSRKTTLLPWGHRMNRWSQGPCWSKFSHMLTAEFLVMVGQLLRHITSRIISRHFVKFDHLGIIILVTSTGFVTVARFFFSILGLVAKYFLSYMAFLEYIADQEYLLIPPMRTGFGLQQRFSFFGFLALRFPLFTLPLAKPS